VIIPLSAVVATRNRTESLSRTFESLLTQAVLPFEFIVVDASDNDATKTLTMKLAERIGYMSTVRWLAADIPGAAPQRNQGVAKSVHPFIWFFDDDIVFEPHCAERLWKAIESDRQLGGVNAMIVNQRYQPPRFVSRTMFTLMHGKREKSFAGRVIGPGINLLPEDREDLPEVVPVEWLNLGCTIYRREALPSPPFDAFFKGYSLMEDLALSLRVGKKWKLANVRDAKIFHDSQLGEHKVHTGIISEMELKNRCYVMTRILSRNTVADYLRLGIWELFQLASRCARWQSWKTMPAYLVGFVRGLIHIIKSK
jgi:GT2 family glycosyltransferase